MDSNNHDYQKIFDELYCKNIIAYFYPELSSFEKHESPDFIGENTCLEIRKALYCDSGELYSFFEKYKEKEYKTIPQKVLKQIGFDQDPMPIDDKNILFMQRRKKDNSSVEYIKTKDEKLILCILIDHSMYKDQYKIIANSITDKVNKLNTNYVSKDINILGIISYECINYELKEVKNNIINLILEEIDKIKSCDLENTFDYIYILFMDCLLKINTRLMIYEENEVTSEIHLTIRELTTNEIANY